jgi:broad specificity phosphatase PhoE
MKSIFKTLPSQPFYFIRHGQTDWNKENKIMGQIDIPLNAVGLEQAQTAAKNIAHLEISHIVSSPLKRALQTAQVISKNMNIPITVIDELTQNYQGVLEGRNKAEVINEITIKSLIEHWRMGGDIEGAEHWSDFVSRITLALNTALTVSSDKKPILIVAHKPVYWALLHILNIKTTDMDTKNCGIYFFKPNNSDGTWLVEEI